MKILLLSDLHLTPKGELVRGQDANAAFERGWREIAPFVKSADVIVVNGDVAHSACIEGYQRLRSAMQGIESKFMVTVGNHDDRERLGTELGAIHLCNSGHAQSARHAVASVVLLDTLVSSRPEGAICSVRLAWLREQLDRARERPVIAIMHHPPVSLGVAALDEVALNEGRTELLDMLSGHSAPVTVFAGHHHIAATGRIGAMSYHVCPPFSGPPARFGFWEQAPVFGPGTNGSCALTVRPDGEVDVRFLVH